MISQPQGPYAGGNSLRGVGQISVSNSFYQFTLGRGQLTLDIPRDLTGAEIDDIERLFDIVIRQQRRWLNPPTAEVP